LENELSLKSTANDELKANIDVYKIDLEQEKERAEQHVSDNFMYNVLFIEV